MDSLIQKHVAITQAWWDLVIALGRYPNGTRLQHL